MLNLRSFYRSLDDPALQEDSVKSTPQQNLTVGICDYIPQSYFYKQYFSVYIDGLQPIKIIHSILWNQYYQKTLLKQIYAQLISVKTKNQNSVIAKLDNMISKTVNGDLIYLKIGSNVYNLKDKLQYGSCSQFQKEIKQNQTLTIEKITQEGKWKKVIIAFGPYKNKAQYDIVFSLQNQRATPSQTNKYSDSINQTYTPQIQTATKVKIQAARKNSSQSERKFYKNTKNSSNKKKDEEKQTSFSKNGTKQKSKSKVDKNSPLKYHKKSLTKIDRIQRTQKKIDENSNDFSQNQIISTYQEKSIKKHNNVFQYTPTQTKALKQINFNSTAKVPLSHSFQNLILEGSQAPTSLDIKRKQNLKVKHNSVMSNENMFTTDSQTMKIQNQQAKNNTVLAQILSKKEEIIKNQKKKIEQMEQKHLKQIQELKFKHLKQTETFKTQISQILNEYSKKYENQKEESRKLRAQLASINEILTENKVIIAELQIKTKFNEEEVVKFSKQADGLKQKLTETQKKYNQLMVSSKQQQMKMGNQRDKAQTLADKYLLKYNNLAKKLRLLIQQEQNIQD